MINRWISFIHILDITYWVNSIFRRIEQVEREIQNGNNNLQSRLEELNAQKTAVGAEYDASAARVRQILDNHAGA